MCKRHGKKFGKKAKGQGVIEIIGSLLFFVMMLCIMVSISLFLYVQHAAVTSVREGTRFAALNPLIGDAATQQQGITQVENYLMTSTQQLSGMNISADEITVTPPDPAAPQGQRTVRVDVRFEMQNPIPVDGFLNAFGASSTAFSSMPINATATMRYEE